jgi:DNA end-binding protein Ku
VTLSPAIRETDVGFNMLERNTQSRIKYKKTCVDCGGREVANDEIVKGYQYEKDKYVIFTDEDFERLKTDRDKNITITQFVDIAEIDPIYFDRAYYVTPTGGENAFTLLLAALTEQARAGIAKTVLGTRETLLLIRANDGKMIANTLFFHDEVVRVPSIVTKNVKAAELTLAKTLIDNMLLPFKPEQFHDEYNARLREAIAQKIAGNEIATPKSAAPTNIVNIMDALKQSVEITKPKTKRAN